MERIGLRRLERVINRVTLARFQRGPVTQRDRIKEPSQS
jgi:hypothetical protein